MATTERKYEFTNETKSCTTTDGRNVTLRRIRALIDIPKHCVRKGDSGGWLENERNLSQDGMCWVSEEAMVSGEARILDDAWVWGYAVVDDNALVEGDTKIGDYASITGNSRVYGKAKVWGCAKVESYAEIGGSAEVFESAIVFGDAKVHGKVAVRGNSRVFYGSHDAGVLNT